MPAALSGNKMAIGGDPLRGLPPGESTTPSSASVPSLAGLLFSRLCRAEYLARSGTLAQDEHAGGGSQLPLLAYFSPYPAGKLAGFFFAVRLSCCRIGRHGPIPP